MVDMIDYAACQNNSIYMLAQKVLVKTKKSKSTRDPPWLEDSSTSIYGKEELR